MYKVANGMAPEIMKYFILVKNLIITYVIQLNLLFHRFIVFTMVGNLQLIQDLNLGNWFQP